MKNNLLMACALMAFSVWGLSSAVAKEESLQPLSMTFSDHAQWSLQIPHDGPVIYQGVVSFDNAGQGAAPIMYPVGGLAEMFAVVFVHGAIVSSAKKKQKTAIQMRADQVLSGYQSVLDDFQYSELMRGTIKNVPISDHIKKIDAQGASLVSGEMVIQSTPAFLMTQDQKSLVLNNQLVIRNVGEPSKAIYSAGVRVITSELDAENPSEYWNAKQGEPLKTKSAELLTQSVNILLSGVGVDFESYPFKTVRYLEGGFEKIERAQVINKGCERMLLRNLRGMFMSVPYKPKIVKEGCEAVAS